MRSLATHLFRHTPQLPALRSLRTPDLIAPTRTNAHQLAALSHLPASRVTSGHAVSNSAASLRVLKHEVGMERAATMA